MSVNIPNLAKPRPYQLAVFKAFDNGTRKFVLRWHRRAGKDEICLHIAAKGAQLRVGNYWHMLPEYSQARKAIWTAINPHTGRRRIDEAFPPEIRKRCVEDQMLIEFKNGSTWQLVGSDNFDKLVGVSVAGMVFSEYALSDSAAWAYFRPIIRENNGFAFFISTVRGQNHFWQLGEYAKSQKDWFFQDLNALQSGVFSVEALEEEKAGYIAELGEEEGLAIFNQEYLNNPNSAIPGAYYAKLMGDAKLNERIANVPYNPALSVYTSWDLGHHDDTVIWFAQKVGQEVRIIDYYENRGQGLDHYVKILNSKPYVYEEHILPHDADVSELGTGKRRVDTLKDLGLRGLRVLPRMSVDDGIHAARTLIPQCWFDVTKTKRGIECLESYHREYDDKKKVFRDLPCHDWSSHAADSFRYLALGLKEPLSKKIKNAPRFYKDEFSL